MRSAVILAGGRSTRFGDRDKAVADLAGRPMIRRVAARLGTVADDLVVNCRPDQVDAITAAFEGFDRSVTVAEDPEPDLGPMAGIQTGLLAADGEYGAVVACDMPFVAPALLEHLFAVAAGTDAAIPRLDDQWFQTTQAVYHADRMAAACERALDRGDRKVLAPLRDLDYVVVDEPTVREVASLETFENVNTAAELADAEARLRQS
jgi:molybdopterin-guanine dinucleotide biosynthesis protein A